MYIRKTLQEMSSKKHQDFLSKLIPNIDPKTILGVKNPELRKLAKTLIKNFPDETKAFLNDLPHYYLEENMLHSFILSNIKDYDLNISYLDKFKDHIDNWAVCDSVRIQTFKKNPNKLFEKIKEWIKSDHPYNKRLAISLLLTYYLKDNFDDKHLKLVADNNIDDYYVKMVVAWYFSMALARQYDSSIKFLEGKILDTWTHNKAIQKAIESRQISDDTKKYLKTLKVK